MKLVLILVAFIHQTLAWWENGHMMVSQIAEVILKQRSPIVYQRANELVMAMEKLAQPINNSFVTAAVWPDDIKDDATQFLDSWHYIDRPINDEGLYLIQNPLETDWNAHDFFRRAQYEFKYDDGSTTFKKVFLMRYILHVVGDVHQPLHAVSMYNTSYPLPDGDLAGNYINVEDYRGVKMNFHSFWDAGAEYMQDIGFNFIERPFNETTQVYFENWAKDLIKQYPEDFYKGEASNIDYKEWTRQSWQIAIDHFYPYIRNTNILDEEYVKQSQEIVRQRITLAGYRLAYFLEDTLKYYRPHTQEKSFLQKNNN